MSAAMRVHEGSDGFAYLVLQAALERFGRAPAELSAEEYAIATGQAARAAAIQRRILARPEAAAVVVADESTEAAYRTIAARYDGTEVFADELARNGLDPGALRAGLERELLVEAAIERVAATAVQVSDTEVEIFYWQHPDRFRRPEMRTARHLLITVNDDFAENSAARARARIDSIAAEVAGDRRRFLAAVQRHSECPSALEEGRLGTLPKGKLYPELDAVLFAMSEGAISEVVESPIGLHLLWCEAVVPGETVPLARVREQVRDILEKRKRRAFLRQWLRQGD